MDSIVLIKQVPDTTEIKLNRKTGNLEREGVKSIPNPDDLHAVESALQLKEEYGGTITVISMGPPQAIDVISEALGMGCDAGILLTDRAFSGADTWATSTTLGQAILKIGHYDLIICGHQAIDGDTAQIGPQIAELLDLPQATCVCDVNLVEKEIITVSKRYEEGLIKLSLPLPALLTVTDELNQPRYPLVGNLLNACNGKAPITIWNAADLGLQANQIGLDGSLTQVMKTFSPKSSRDGEIFTGDTKTVVNSLVDKLRIHQLV